MKSSVAWARFSRPGSAACAQSLRLFLGKAQCVNCHNGPLFTNNAFHNTGVLNAPGITPAAGRSAGLRLALVGHNEAEPLGLRAVEKRQLLAFLRSLEPLAEGE